MPTIAELALSTQNELAAALIDATYLENVVINQFEALPMMGTKFDSLVWKTDPAAVGFLRRGTGYTHTAGALAKGEVQASRVGMLVKEACSTVDEFDRNLAKAGITGIAGWLQQTAAGRLKSEFSNVEKQIFYGTANDTIGFQGLKQICSYVAANVLATTDGPEASSYAKSVINAGGVTSNIASSVYTVNMAPSAVHLRVGGGQGMAGFLALSEIKRQLFEDSSGSGTWQEHYYGTAEGYIGLNVGGSGETYADRTYVQYDVRRLANLTVLVPLTEALLDTLIESHPDGHKPNIIFMGKRSQRQLRDSRNSNVQKTFDMSAGTAQSRTLTTRAPLPESHNGVPIVATDKILATDAIES